MNNFFSATTKLLLTACLGWGLATAQTSFSPWARGLKGKSAISRQPITAQVDRPELILQTGHAKSVDGMAFSPDGRLLASASADSTIKLWDVATGRELRSFIGHTGGVKAVAFSADGKLLASGGVGGKLKCWDVATGREVWDKDAHSNTVNALAFSSDGRLASGGADNLVKLWDAATGQEVRTLSGHVSWVLAVAFSPNGQLLAAGSADGLIKLWEVTTSRKPRDLGGHTGRVKSVAFSNDGQWLASGSLDATVKLWKVASGSNARTLRQPGKVIAVGFSAPGAALISGSENGTVKRFEVPSGRESQTLTGPSSLETTYEAMAFSPDGHWQALNSGARDVELRDLATGQEPRTLTSRSSNVSAIGLSRNGRWVAVGNKEYNVKLWDAASGRQLRTLVGESGSINALTFSPDEKWLAAGSEGGVITLWEIMTGRKESWVAHRDNIINALAFSPDGQWLVSGSQDKTIKLWEVASRRELFTLSGHTSEVYAAAFSPDGKWLASGGTDRTVKLWDLATRKIARTFTDHTGEVSATAFSPDNTRLASGSKDGTIKLRDISTGALIQTLRSQGQVSTIAFSPDGHCLVSGNVKGGIQLWETATGRERFNLNGHSGDVTGVAFDPQNRWFASGSDDGSSRIWDAEKGELLATLVSLRGSDDWLVVTPDGSFDGSPAAWGQILWRFAQTTENVAPVEVFFNDFYYPDLLADVLKGKKLPATQDITQRDRRLPEVKFLPSGERALTSVTSRDLTVKLEVKEQAKDGDHSAGSGAFDVRLFRNGSLVKAWRGDVLQGRASVTLEESLPVIAGENRLTAYAFNRDNVKSLDAALIVNGAAALKRPGTVYLLTVGINSYANSEFDLKFAENDARAFGEEMQRQQREIGRFARVEVIPLFNQEATKSNFLAALRQLAGDRVEALPANAPAVLRQIKQAEPEDAVIIYFAGHGVAEQNQFYLIPHDLGYQGTREKLGADQDGQRLIFARSLSDRELEQRLEKVDAGHLLLVIDACESGQALEAEERRRGPMNSKGLAQLAYEKGMYILTAAQAYQAAKETEKLGHGYLTYALIEEALKQGVAVKDAKDGALTARRWMDYATERVPQLHQETERINQAKAAATEKPAATEKLTSAQKPDAARRLVQTNAGLEVLHFQRPRIFYRREIEAHPLIVAQSPVR